MQTTPSSSTPLSANHSMSNPIDLTLEDDSDYSSRCDRKPKRHCTANRAFLAANDVSHNLNHLRLESHHSGLSPAMSSSSLQPEHPSSARPTPPLCSPMAPSTPQYANPILRSAFTGPSNSSAFFPKTSSQPGPSSLAMPKPQAGSQPYSAAPCSAPRVPYPPQSHSQDYSRQVIDLTNSPSPPPMSRPPSQPPQQASIVQQTQPSLPPDLPPKTPVCIGQLTVTALVLYPINYLQPQCNSGPLDAEWAPVRMNYEHNAARPDNSETIHIRTPNMTNADGEAVPGESFGVVEQKVATYLGPMLGKGLIRLDGKVRRGPPNVRGLISQVAYMLTP